MLLATFKIIEQCSAWRGLPAPARCIISAVSVMPAMGFLRSWETVLTKVFFICSSSLKCGHVAENGGHADRLAVGRAHRHHARLCRAPIGQRKLDHPGRARGEEIAQLALRKALGEQGAGDGLGVEAEHGVDGGVGHEHEAVPLTTTTASCMLPTTAPSVLCSSASP